MSGNLKNKVYFLTLLFPIILLPIFPLMTCESDENPRVKWPCEEDSLVECGGDYYKTPIPICSCKLSREITYNGITLPKGSRIKNPSDNYLYYSKISESIYVFGILFPKDTIIYFDNENDWVDYFEISDSIPVYVGIYPCLYSIRLFKNGQFRGCITNENISIQGYNCHYGIFFYENGQLKGCCPIDKDCYNFDEKFICFDELGNSISCEGLSK